MKKRKSFADKIKAKKAKEQLNYITTKEVYHVYNKKGNLAMRTRFVKVKKDRIEKNK